MTRIGTPPHWTISALALAAIGSLSLASVTAKANHMPDNDIPMVTQSVLVRSDAASCGAVLDTVLRHAGFIPTVSTPFQRVAHRGSASVVMACVPTLEPAGWRVEVMAMAPTVGQRAGLAQTFTAWASAQSEGKPLSGGLAAPPPGRAASGAICVASGNDPNAFIDKTEQAAHALGYALFAPQNLGPPDSYVEAPLVKRDVDMLVVVSAITQPSGPLGAALRTSIVEILATAATPDDASGACAVLLRSIALPDKVHVR